MAHPIGGGDVVEAALAEKLEAARAAGDWSAVAALALELDARAKARVAGVIDLNERRRERR